MTVLAFCIASCLRESMILIRQARAFGLAYKYIQSVSVFVNYMLQLCFKLQNQKLDFKFEKFLTNNQLLGLRFSFCFWNQNFLYRRNLNNYFLWNYGELLTCMWQRNQAFSVKITRSSTNSILSHVKKNKLAVCRENFPNFYVTSNILQGQNNLFNNDFFITAGNFRVCNV